MEKIYEVMYDLKKKDGTIEKLGVGFLWSNILNNKEEKLKDLKKTFEKDEKILVERFEREL